MTPSEAALHALTQAAKEGRLTTHLRNPPAPVNTFTGKNISPQARAAMRGAEIQIGKNPKLLPAQRNRERAKAGGRINACMPVKPKRWLKMT